MLFGREPDVIVRDDIECMWQVREAAWIYIVRDAERAGKSLVTMLVKDLESHLREFSARGLKGWSTDTLPGVYRKALFLDPDGNAVTFAETLNEPDEGANNIT
jgi:hypothetical protein